LKSLLDFQTRPWNPNPTGIPIRTVLQAARVEAAEAARAAAVAEVLAVQKVKSLLHFVWAKERVSSGLEI
jgi:hypothetical protein